MINEKRKEMKDYLEIKKALYILWDSYNSGTTLSSENYALISETIRLERQQDDFDSDNNTSKP